MTPSTIQPLTTGVQVNCYAPCAPEDAFAIDDLKTWLAAQGIPVNTTSAVNILVARYGTPLAHSIYTDSLAPRDPAAECPTR